MPGPVTGTDDRKRGRNDWNRWPQAVADRPDRPDL